MCARMCVSVLVCVQVYIVHDVLVYKYEYLSQIKVHSIHVRYEDRVTDPQHPMAAGVTLDSIEMQVIEYLIETHAYLGYFVDH